MGKVLDLAEAKHAAARAKIVRTLARVNGNRTRAAEALGIRRTSLLRLMKQYGVR